MICEICRLGAMDISPINMVSIGSSKGRKSRRPEDSSVRHERYHAPAILIDDYVLLIHPLVLGSGRRLFPDGGAAATLRLVATSTTGEGVVIVTYQPASP